MISDWFPHPGRKWIAAEIREDYLRRSEFRFDDQFHLFSSANQPQDDIEKANEIRGWELNF